MPYDPNKFPAGEQEPLMTVMFENITTDEVIEYLKLGKHINGSLIVDLDGHSVLSIGNANGLGGSFWFFNCIKYS